MRFSRVLAGLFFACAVALSGCGNLPSSGFLRTAVDSSNGSGLEGIQVVEITDAVARRLQSLRTTQLFSQTLGTKLPDTEIIRPGDVLEVVIWEAPPPTLFTSGSDPRTSVTTAPPVTSFPAQVVSGEGDITIPFAGRVHVAGRVTKQVEADIAMRLKDMAHLPQVLVRRTQNLTSDVTVVGDVTGSARLPLSPRGERLLDALAAVGGVRQPVNKVTIQVTRGKTVQSMPLEAIIRDPAQNVPLQPGDVITAYFEPLSFTSLGATGKNAEITYEAQGITLAQALARAGGLQDYRSDSRGVFLFRFEPKDALNWPKQPIETTPDGRVPVIYRLDLNDPRSFLVSQSFPINNRDMLYISNASLAEFQKFLTLIGSVVGPAATFKVLTQ